ncbi:DUF362 domain-containing protein [Gelria sp. Kuro-4]|jgi:Fe-S-cluster-containing hydrogenase component 2|uniref:DUF362 domain-containing protein n=1 Tax=Gelria sp. Kuro-4 TaxID=2796927 RepID=UPI001BF11A0E|nr:4Fe-4S binding protein [Gelria sp. Kuro-4]BCV24855.1 (4Fe-4S)-binding protein [Gelria sp. Kuro-4]
MRIDEDKCIGCGVCMPYCPAGAISIQNKKAHIDRDKCLECGTCGRARVVRCPRGAIHEDEDVYQRPRSIRKYFSDPMAYHVETKVPGRGTEEVKTNDVTGRVKKGQFGIAIEMGRPCLGASFVDIEKVTMALAREGITRFERDNPLTHLMADPEKGIFTDEAKQCRVVSAIIEFTIPDEMLERTLATIKEVAQEIDTVFSLDLISRLENEPTIAVAPQLEVLGITPRPNAKVNLGLGRPLKED